MGPGIFRTYILGYGVGKFLDGRVNVINTVMFRSKLINGI